ncbi:DUF1893 domain-containing protein, partial [Bacteroidales bacterium OttesenSCG-928-A14]|nr:DUF1893 domain-containing protein [Bacteroidales bacterium OttesenSCG-928-A14]
LGGVNELYTDLISNPALQILEQQHIKTSYQKKVEVILNRTQNDWCPLERLCFNENSLEANLKNIGDFIN